MSEKLEASRQHQHQQEQMRLFTKITPLVRNLEIRVETERDIVSTELQLLQLLVSIRQTHHDGGVTATSL